MIQLVVGSLETSALTDVDRKMRARCQCGHLVFVHAEERNIDYERGRLLFRGQCLYTGCACVRRVAGQT